MGPRRLTIRPPATRSINNWSKSVEIVDEVAKNAFGDALEILQLITLMRRQNTVGINKCLSEKGAADPARAIRNAFVSRITTLASRCYSKVTRDDDRNLRRAFECLDDPAVRSAFEKRSDKGTVTEAIELWKKLDANDSALRVKHFRDKLTAHWAKPNPDIAIPAFKELFEFSEGTAQLIEKLARVVGGKGETLNQFQERYAATAESFWKPWEGPPDDSGRSLTFFRLVKYTYNQQGQLAERAVLFGRYVTREAAIIGAETEAARNASWAFDAADARWRITDRQGRVHFLSVEG
jgi:hypothetical protein